MSEKETKVTEDVADATNNSEVLLEVRNLKKYFPVGEDFFGRPTNQLKAVDDARYRRGIGLR